MASFSGGNLLKKFKLVHNPSFVYATKISIMWVRD